MASSILVVLLTPKGQQKRLTLLMGKREQKALPGLTVDGGIVFHIGELLHLRIITAHKNFDV